MVLQSDINMMDGNIYLLTKKKNNKKSMLSKCNDTCVRYLLIQS